MNKSTRKKILMQLCLLGLLVIGTTSGKAQLLGTLNHAESWSIEFVGLGSSNVADVTVTFIDSRGKQDVDVFTIPISGTDRTHHRTGRGLPPAPRQPHHPGRAFRRDQRRLER